MLNNDRFDLSNWLIHFFRAVDPNGPDMPNFPESFGFGYMDNWDVPFSPFFLMRNVVCRGRLWATWAERGERRTIYGPDPAVCFTEMPIAAFVEAGLTRAERGEAMSSYGLVLPKTDMFAVGARPVIYGLSGSPSITATSDGGRHISPTQLPPLEQFRYVTYSPDMNRPVDWTHEREWRWPLRNAPKIELDGCPPQVEQLYGLELDTTRLQGMGAIVKNSRQADQLIYDILTKVDRGDVDERRYSFVLTLDSVGDISRLRDRAELNAALSAAAIDLSSFFTMSRVRAQALSAQFADAVRAVESAAPPPEVGELGGCWLWITDTGHEMARALLMDGRIQVTRQGKYVAELYEYDDGRSVRQRQEKELGLRSTYFSVLFSDDPNDVPFYNGDELDNKKYYCYSDDDEDY
jgi:hypothetical protein